MLLMLASCGCGTIREQRATNQLLLSDAVDRAVANVNFSPLAYEKVYLDSRFLQFKNDSAVTTNYVISSLRQQMVVAGCLLQDRQDDADYVVEARIGTMGADGHDINYGVPASTTVNSAAALVSAAPPLPALPEISLARKTEDMAAVKLAVFAYARESRMPVWQSGTSIARSESSGTWILGAGPFKRGAIHERRNYIGPRNWQFQKKAKDDDLVEADYRYRGTAVWDQKLAEKMESGDYMTPPNELNPDAPAVNGLDEPEHVVAELPSEE